MDGLDLAYGIIFCFHSTGSQYHGDMGIFQAGWGSPSRHTWIEYHQRGPIVHFPAWKWFYSHHMAWSD